MIKKIYTNLKKLVINEFKKVNQKKILFKKLKILNGRYLMILLDNKFHLVVYFQTSMVDLIALITKTNLKLHQI